MNPAAPVGSTLGADAIVVASIIGQLKLGDVPLALMAWTLIGGSYVFAVVLPLAARYGHRGLKAEAPALNRLLYAGSMIGAMSLLLGTALLVFGAYAAW